MARLRPVSYSTLDMAGLAVRGVRDRRVCPSHRRLARQFVDEHGPRSGCARTGAVRAPTGRRWDFDTPLRWGDSPWVILEGCQDLGDGPFQCPPKRCRFQSAHKTKGHRCKGSYFVW